MSITSVAVYCGARDGARPVYREAASQLGRALGRRKLTVVYGGARHGLMGAMADGALAEGSKVIGILPRGLERAEFAHPGASELHRVDTMHQRKAMMAELAGAFIAMPGGFGTLDELFEVLTWVQVGLHAKPVGLLDVDGYWSPLRAQIALAVREGFIPEALTQALIAESDPDVLVERLLKHRPPEPVVKWIAPGA